MSMKRVVKRLIKKVKNKVKGKVPSPDTPPHKRPGVISTLAYISPTLAKVVGKEPMTRGQVVKRLWGYIKENGLQDEKNRRMILPDELLADVFGTKKPVEMFSIGGLLNKHLTSGEIRNG